MASKTPKREWESFVRSPEYLKEGVEIPLILHDLTPGRRKYAVRHVIAVVDRQSDALSDADTLWVRSSVGVRLQSPYSIRIVRELPAELPGTPYYDVFQALGRAGDR
jgi:hypothetical protein